MDTRREDPTIGTTGGGQAAQDHLAELRDRGGSYRSIAAAAGLGPMTVHGLATGRRQPTKGTAAAVLAVTPATLRHARIDAGGTRLRLRALHVMGHSSARIARAVGASDKTIRKLLRGDARTVSSRLRDAIADLYDAWWDKRPPERTRAERAAPAPPAAAPSPATGAPAPPSTTTSSTSPVTGPATAGNAPPAPAPPQTSPYRPKRAGIEPRSPGRNGRQEGSHDHQTR